MTSSNSFHSIPQSNHHGSGPVKSTTLTSLSRIAPGFRLTTSSLLSASYSTSLKNPTLLRRGMYNFFIFGLPRGSSSSQLSSSCAGCGARDWGLGDGELAGASLAVYINVDSSGKEMSSSSSSSTSHGALVAGAGWDLDFVVGWCAWEMPERSDSSSEEKAKDCLSG